MHLFRKSNNRIVFLSIIVAFLFLLYLSRRNLAYKSLSKSYQQVESGKNSVFTFDKEIENDGDRVSSLNGDNEYINDDEVKEDVEEKDTLSQVAPSDTNTVSDEATDDQLPAVCTTPLHFLQDTQRRKNPVALASFPGSGNTWLRFLIEQGSRVYTGSVYQDVALNETYAGEGLKGTKVIAVKTHYPCPNCWTYQKCPWCAGTLPVTASMTGIVKGSDAAVFMLRSPFDALLAEFNRIRTGQHAGKLKPEAFSKVPARKSYETEFDKPTWNQFINQRLVAYSLAARTYLDRVTEAKTPKQIEQEKTMSANKLTKDEFIAADRFVSKGGKITKLVFYERLKADPEKEMARVFSFFNDIYEVEGLTDSFLTPAQQAARCSMLHNKRAQTSHFKWLRNNTEVYNPWKPGQVKQVCEVLGKWWFKEVWGECMDGKLQIQRTPAAISG